jgi:acetoin:2,6-dichlorophenolindophenol oxidoreductase subunit beta
MATEAGKPVAMSRAMNKALHDAMVRDEKVLVFGEDIADPIGGVWRVTKGLSTEFGTARVRATPIAEQAIVGAAIGAAIGGYRPVAEIMFFDFIAIAMDQIINHAAKLRYMSGGATPVPITIQTVVGSGRYGAQHTQALEAWFMHTPGIKVVMPSTPADAYGLLTACIFDDDPCLFIQHSNMLFGAKELVGEPVPLGKAAIRKSGDAATIIGYGPTMARALQAAEQLATDGIEVEVIDLRTLMPLDMDTVLESVEKTRHAIVVHDATTFCGPGAEIAARISESLFGELASPVARLGAPYAPLPFADELNVFPTVEDILAAVTERVRGVHR